MFDCAKRSWKFRNFQYWKLSSFYNFLNRNFPTSVLAAWNFPTSQSNYMYPVSVHVSRIIQFASFCDFFTASYNSQFCFQDQSLALTKPSFMSWPSSITYIISNCKNSELWENVKNDISKGEVESNNRQKFNINEIKWTLRFVTDLIISRTGQNLTDRGNL